MDKNALDQYFKPVCECCTPGKLRLLSDISLCLGFASIIISIVAWATAKRENQAHGERLGIFIGLWVPSFFILANRLSRKADELAEN
jgi:hypothetical protein